jgi:enoyl-CoA hydratase/carnithine racemase
MSAHFAAAGGVAAVRWESGSDGVLQVTLSTQATAGAIDAATMVSWTGLASYIESHRASVSGVIICSDTPGWFGRTDLLAASALAGEAPAGLAQRCAEFARALRQIEQTVPTVAVIEGCALGVGLEIALACHHRIALDDDALEFGLPDVGMGLLPTAGGVSRAVRMLGFVDAFQKVLSSGAAFSPKAALVQGLVQQLVTDPAELVPAARQWVTAHANAHQPWDRKGWQMPDASPASASHYFTLHALPALLRKEHPCAQSPAPLQLLAAAVECALAGDFEAASRVEQRHVLQVLSHPSTQHRLRVLHADLLGRRFIPGLSGGAPALRERLARPWVLGNEEAASDWGAHAQDFAQDVARGVAQQMAQLLEEGVPLASIEQAARTAGFQAGAVALLQRFVFSTLPQQAPFSAPRLATVPMPLDVLQQRLLQAGARAALQHLQTGTMPESEVANSISVFGAGYPAWTGGALRYAQRLGMC